MVEPVSLGGQCVDLHGTHDIEPGPLQTKRKTAAPGEKVDGSRFHRSFRQLFQTFPNGEVDARTGVYISSVFITARSTSP